MAQVEKNLCRSCGIDFGRLSYFDDHRRTGKCFYHPEQMGLEEYNGVWYTPEMIVKIKKSVEAMRK